MLKLPILYYHLISTPPAVAADARRVYVEPERFRRQLAMLKRLGYRDVPLGRAVELLQAGLPLHGRKVCLTFDDGHLDNYTQAWPILREAGYSATIFVCAGLIGGRLKLRRGEEAAAPIMDAEQLRELAEGGIEIGAHGMTHANLADIDDAAAWREIVDSRAVLEDVLQRPVRFFAYPYGSFRPRHLEMVEQAGYLAAVGTTRGRVHREDERFCLKRIPVHHERSLPGLLYHMHLKSYRRAQRRLDARRGLEPAHG